jgi:hypothetical protein
VNSAYLAIVATLTALMLVIFLATGQPLHLTVTAVIVGAALGLGATYIYSREEELEDDLDFEEDDHIEPAGRADL